MATATKRRKKPSKTRGGVNKAQAIRDAAKKIGGKVRPKDVIAALAEQGIVVSSPQVSSTLKAAGYRRTRRGRPAGSKSKGKTHTADTANGLSLEHLIAAKALATKLGSVEAAKRAIDVLARLA